MSACAAPCPPPCAHPAPPHPFPPPAAPRPVLAFALPATSSPPAAALPARRCRPPSSPPAPPFPAFTRPPWTATPPRTAPVPPWHRHFPKWPQPCASRSFGFWPGCPCGGPRPQDTLAGRPGPGGILARAQANGPLPRLRAGPRPRQPHSLGRGLVGPGPIVPLRDRPWLGHRFGFGFGATPGFQCRHKSLLMALAGPCALPKASSPSLGQLQPRPQPAVHRAHGRPLPHIDGRVAARCPHGGHPPAARPSPARRRRWPPPLPATAIAPMGDKG